MSGLIRIHGGRLVTPAGVMENGSIIVETGRIRDITTRDRGTSVQAYNIDATGLWVLPGIIDIHSDAIEMELGPRPNTFFPMEVSFHELERKLAGQGITTVYHSLAMTNFRREKRDHPLRQNEMVGELISNIRAYIQHPRMIQHKIHLRFEITNIEARGQVEQLLQDNHIDEISFMDHTPGQGQFRDLEAHKIRMMMYNKQLSETDAGRIMLERLQAPKVDADTLTQLAALANRRGIPIASHDDDSIGKLDMVKKWGVTISEFPTTMEVATEAKRRGLFTVAGAPNVLRGESHSGNLSALDAIQANVIDILCSDYYPPSLVHSVFFLHARGLPMPRAVNMVSLNPAKAVGIADETGSLEVGKAADLLLIREEMGVPVIEKVLVRGNIVCQMDYARSSSPWRV